MTLIKLNLDGHRTDEFGWRSNLGIRISHWCQERGLVRDQDYTWALMTAENELHFIFHGDDPAFATMFALHWAEYL